MYMIKLQECDSVGASLRIYLRISYYYSCSTYFTIWFTDNVDPKFLNHAGAQ